SLAFGQIGTLSAGHEAPVKINCAYVASRSGRYFCFPLLFSKGIEIRTSQSDSAALFFHARDVRGHDALMARYLQENPNSDKPAMAYLRFPPLLPVGQDPRALPQGIEARFDVTGSGRVESVNLTPQLDPQVSASIERALDGWLFLPRLKKGVPTRTTIRLPLSFDSAS
ncbi:MAG TPA: energy transducer TonB, partial [Opitutaceae bacterium]